MNSTATNPQVMRRKEVEARTGLARSTIYDRLSKKSPRFDSSFPKPIKIGASAVGWISDEINEWIKSQIAASRKGD